VFPRGNPSLKLLGSHIRERSRDIGIAGGKVSFVVEVVDDSRERAGDIDGMAALYRVWYDGDIMMSRTQITLDNEMQRRARRRASDLGVSLAEYFRRLVARDLARPEAGTDVNRIFDLGNSGGSDIARDKDAMIAEAVHSSRRKRR
jgi:hypothetical protein